MRIVSGGQTGADRAALDSAIACGIAHGGWCPKGRRALDGALDARYHLRETPSADYLQRNEWNVRDSDATVVFTLAETITGGSLKTVEFATKQKKPLLHLHPALNSPAVELKIFIAAHSVDTLNVAGSRESKEPGIYAWVREVLDEALSATNCAECETPLL